MIEMPDEFDRVHCDTADCTAQQRKAELGQFMTPETVARFMASLFPQSTLRTCRLLDAGAGLGALSSAFLARWAEGGFGFADVELTVYEIDAAFRPQLSKCLARYTGVRSKIITADYIEHATAECPAGPGYTHAIINPPYRKISTHSEHRLALRKSGIETVNLYAAFMALAVAQAAPGGQIVAIIPRSCCNGLYYRSFRDFILARSAIRHIHLFSSRSRVFKDDDVLQETIIIRVERGGRQESVTVSTSSDGNFSDLVIHEHPFARIVFPDHPERFFHIPTSLEKNTLEQSRAVRSTLDDLAIQVSTGPVLDYRLKTHLRAMPQLGTVPLLCPDNFRGSETKWPIAGGKKANAIVRDAESEKLLYPSGSYCVVRRISAKEGRRRIVASVVDPAAFGDAPMLGIENHLNVFHDQKRGIPKALAHGLAMFLNSTAVDEYFRSCSGSTQVNATDLRSLKYPTRDMLIRLGVWALQQEKITQARIDAELRALIGPPNRTIASRPHTKSSLSAGLHDPVAELARIVANGLRQGLGGDANGSR